MLGRSLASSVEVRSQMAASCSKLLHLKDKVLRSLSGQMEKVGRRQ